MLRREWQYLHNQTQIDRVQPLFNATLRELRRLGEQDSCIFAGAVLVELLRSRGYRNAYPLTVKPIVLNPNFAMRLRTEPFPRNALARAKWADEGCPMVSIGAYGAVSTRDIWAAHLAVVLPNFFGERHLMCDLTIIQANRPEWKIYLRPVFLRVPEAFVSARTTYRAWVNGSTIIYRAFPRDKSYETAPIWKNRRYRDQALKTINEYIDRTPSESPLHSRLPNPDEPRALLHTAAKLGHQ
jgi:hypothetical protein